MINTHVLNWQFINLLKQFSIMFPNKFALLSYLVIKKLYLKKMAHKFSLKKNLLYIL